MFKFFLKYFIACGIIYGFFNIIFINSSIAALGDFGKYEIRVIRPKYFSKKRRFELTGQGMVILNHPYIYTFMASGILGYHFSEYLGMQLSGAFGLALERSEKKVLFQEFNVKTTIFRTAYVIDTAVLYTPAYGKVQLPATGKLLYFDTYILLGGGMTGVNWQYSDFCFDKSEQNAALAIKTNKIGMYPTFSGGLGQRIFYTKSDAIKWDIKLNRIIYPNIDKECYVGADASGSNSFDNVMLNFGISRFF